MVEFHFIWWIIIGLLLILLAQYFKSNWTKEGFDPGNPDDVEWLEEPIDQYDLRFLQNAGLMPTGKFSYDKFREIFNSRRASLTRTQNTYLNDRRIIKRLQHQDIPEKVVTDQNVQQIINQGGSPNQITIIPEVSNPDLCYCPDPTKKICDSDCVKFSEILKDKNQLTQTALNQISKYYCQHFAKNKADLERRGVSLEVDDTGSPFYGNCKELSPGVFRARHYPGGFGEAIQISQYRTDPKTGETTINIWNPLDGLKV